MAAPIALIQGASRGLGLEFCRHILKNKSLAGVIATCRNPDGATELRGLADQHPGRLTVLKLDVDQEEDIRGAAERVKESFGRLDLIVNSSAMLHPSGKGETSLRDVSAQGIISTLTTNTVGPLVMAKYFVPLLQKGGGGFGQQPAETAKQHSGIVVNITAKVGSIGDNGISIVLIIVLKPCLFAYASECTNTALLFYNLLSQVLVGGTAIECLKQLSTWQPGICL
ncbi:uncharacterized protein LOC114447317 isoform X2 [Parambassis ranga]|uniref:Uncharacterized protein LOC114447317 isoform X2 n=1 Tax=Parambassis ranga TaxID=210632 RepID=A0A6P7JV13_9TELE|nr:uncharacterized protein LOC114447317 isoform X2 [Parambassis ranga]